MNSLERQSVYADQLAAQKWLVEAKNTALPYGILGATLAAAMGLAAGLAVRNWKAAFSAALLGTLAGAAAGAGSSWALAPMFTRYNTRESGLSVLFPTHAGIFIAIGAVAGLAFALGLRDRRKLAGGLLAGALGGLLGTFIVEAVVAGAFPLMSTLEIVPQERIPRLLTHFCVAVTTALCIGWASRETTA
jgi:hypothetical protein